MNQRKWGPCFVLLCALSTTAFSSPAFAEESATSIRRILFIIHPYCWSMSGDKVPDTWDPTEWNTFLTWELELHKKYQSIISKMDADEAVVIFPIGDSKPMRELKEHARAELGDRCVIVERSSLNPDFLTGVDDPIRKFLDDSRLSGKSEWLQGILTDQGKRDKPAGVATELEKELREACQTIGYDWRPQSLEVIYYNRLVAHEILEKFQERNLTYDPQTVECKAVGEGFDQCAMTWKSMLPRYMKLAKPIENDVALSVPGLYAALSGEFQERVDLGNGVRLFLWLGPDGESIALFTRVSLQWSDPLLYATMSLKELDLEVSGVAINRVRGRMANQMSVITLGPRFDPSPVVQPDPDHLRVPIFAGSRRGGDHAYYIAAPDVDPEKFRAQLVAAELSTAPKSDQAVE